MKPGFAYLLGMRNKALAKLSTTLSTLNTFCQEEATRRLLSSNVCPEGQIDRLADVAAFLMVAGPVITGPPPRRVAATL